MAPSLRLVPALACALSLSAFADGTLNDAATTARLGGVGNYLFRGTPQTPAAREIEDAASNLVEIISFSQSSRDEDPDRDVIVISFKPASAQLARDSGAALDRAAAELKSPAGLKAEIAGYSDGGMPSEAGDSLSSERARVVMEALRKRGVPQSKVFWAGRGGAQAVSRRAEILIR